MRRLIAFPCEGETLVGTLDAAAGDTGLLIVSGGNEIRAGAHRGMAMLAATLSTEGFPVFRFDRRGVGDSTGENHGFRSSAPDIAAAVATFRAQTGVTRLIAFGNCDGAAALALFGRDAGIDALVLANPWLSDPVDDLPPPAAIRARYAERLRDPAAWRRLLGGGVSLRNLVRGLVRVAAPPPQPQSDILAAITGWGDDARIILATGDATAIAFDAAAGPAVPACRIATASHSFAGEATALAQALVAALR